MGWPGFAAVFAAFLLTHSLPLRPAVRARLVSWLGAGGFAMAYSLLSVAMLGLLIHTAGEAPYVMLWPQAPWQVAAVQAGMAAVCLLAAFGLARPNPFSFGGLGNGRFDPARAGIVRHVRHPLLLAMGLWGGLHLLPNGDLAHLLLFGVLGGFALLGMRLVDRRKRRQMGPETWREMRRALAATPRLQAPLSLGGAALRLAVAAGVYAALLWLHPLVIGVVVI